MLGIWTNSSDVLLHNTFLGFVLSCDTGLWDVGVPWSWEVAEVRTNKILVQMRVFLTIMMVVTAKIIIARIDMCIEIPTLKLITPLTVIKMLYYIDSMKLL